MRTDRRFQRQKATALRLNNGWPTLARKVFPCSCFRSQPPQSDFTSTSYRAPLTTIWDFSKPIHTRPWKERLGNPVWHIHAGVPADPEVLDRDEHSAATISFAMLLNLAAVSNTETPSVLWGFLRRYCPLASPETHPRLDHLVHYAVAYFRDFVAPRKHYRDPDDVERSILIKIASTLAELPSNASADEIQHALYDLARPIPRYQNHSAKGATAARPGVSNEFFDMIYAVLLGEDRGPRLGSFMAIYGLQETRKLIEKALAGELSRQPKMGATILETTSSRLAEPPSQRRETKSDSP